MRFLTSLSAGISTLVIGGAALGATPGLVQTSGNFTKLSAHATAEDAARAAVLAATPGALGADLGRAKETVLSSGRRVIKLRQAHMGVPVVQRGATVTFESDGSARRVVAHIEGDLPASVTPSVAPAKAAEIAKKRAGLAADASHAALAIWPTGDGNKLTWVVAPPAIPGTPYVPVVVVDATSGAVILAYNAAKMLNQAQVFPSNPLKSPALINVTLPVDAGKTTLENTLVQSKNCIDNKTVKNLFGFAVHVCDLEQKAVADANGDFLIAPGANNEPEDAFSEVSMFYHANRAYDFFRAFSPALNVNNGAPLPTVSNLRVPQGFDTLDPTKLGDPNLPLAPFQNAFFAPSNPIFSQVFGLNGAAMWFGQGPVNDYSYDGDVVYHEFTHAVVEATLQLVGTPHMDKFGASYSPGGMNEGLADYFSSALTGDPDVGEYASQDFFPGSTAIRTLDNQDSCPKDIGGEVHQDSTLFSGALWDVRKTLDAAKQAQLDEAIFAAMNSSATGDLGFEDFANMIIDAVTASPLGATVATALTNAFTAHGVLPQCTRILEFTSGTLNGPKALSNLWFAPGTQTTGAAQTGWTPGVVQFHHKMPENTVKLNASFTKVNISSGGFGMGGTPFAPKVLVRFSPDPIEFTYKPLKTTDDVIVVDPAAAGSTFTASVDVPQGATDAYVMIVSAGETDGAYKAFTIATEQSMGSSSSSTGAGGGGGSGGGGGGEDGGCGCAVPGGEPISGAALLGAIAALGLAASRRRRRA